MKEAAMLVRDVMTRDVVTVSPKTSVLNARRLLATHRIRHLPVVVGDEVVGLVSSRDIAITDVQLIRSLDALESDLLTGRYRRIEAVMSAPAHVVTPDEPVQRAAEHMIDRRIGALPVVEHGRLVGIIALTDCVRAMLGDLRYAVAAAPRVEAGLPSTARRPGQPDPKPAAMVVDPSPSQRLAIRNELTALGYQVSTCPGPTAGVFCPASNGSSMRCARVQSDTVLVLLDEATARTGAATTYEHWLEGASVRVAHGPSARLAQPWKE
jgi:CBS domain-containing protein